MSSNTNNEQHDPVANLSMRPAKGILKSNTSIDYGKQDIEYENPSSLNKWPKTSTTLSDSKNYKIPHFDEMNIIATYHPPDKDYGHMKIEEPKTPYAPNEDIGEEIQIEASNAGINPQTLAQRLNQSTIPSEDSSRFCSNHLSRRSIDEDIDLSPEALEYRKQFENHRKKHYNEFEVVRLRKKEIEDELRALEEEEQREKTGSDSYQSEDRRKTNETEASSHSTLKSIHPILVHSHSKDSSSTHHHVHVEIDRDNEQILTSEERERKRQFELKRKKHYSEFHAARVADQSDDES